MKGSSPTGTDPGKDGVTSTCPGSTFQSKRDEVYLENFTVIVDSDQGSCYLFDNPSRKDGAVVFLPIIML